MNQAAALLVLAPSTRINAPVKRCFDLARSIDLHLDTMKHIGERAIAGVTSGLIGLNETVAWKARHFGVVMKLTSKITECSYPEIFADEIVTGPFKMMKHKHVFEQKEGCLPLGRISGAFITVRI